MTHEELCSTCPFADFCQSGFWEKCKEAAELEQELIAKGVLKPPVKLREEDLYE